MLVAGFSAAKSSCLDKVSPEVLHQIDGNAAAVGVEIRGGTGEHLSSNDLARIAAPTMVIIGDRSHRFFEASARRLTETTPGARLERLAGASHFLQLERSEAIAQLIRNTMEQTRAA
jgi:pimeloyl-ACP methyl ester carboxylesterase